MDIARFLSRVPLFEGLPTEQLDRLAAIVVEKRLSKGDTVFLEGDEGNGFYVVVAGRVKVFKVSPEGKEQILHILGPGEPFGEVAVFAGRRFPAHSMAMEPSRVLFFARKSFIALIEQHPSAALNMLAILSKRLRVFTHLIDDLSLKEVPGRLSAYLLSLSRRDEGGPDLELDISKGQLAGRLGTIPETLSRILAKMVRNRLIELDGPRIRILDRQGLEDLVSSTRRLS